MEILLTRLGIVRVRFSFLPRKLARVIAMPAADATQTDAENSWAWIERPDADNTTGVPDIAPVSPGSGDSEPHPPVIRQESEAGE